MARRRRRARAGPARRPTSRASGSEPTQSDSQRTPPSSPTSSSKHPEGFDAVDADGKGDDDDSGASTQSAAVAGVVSNYPDRIPVIVTLSGKEHKLLCQSDMTAGSLMYVVRKRVHLEPSVAIFLMQNGRLMLSGASLLIECERDDDGILRLEAREENTFGSGRAAPEPPQCPCGERENEGIGKGAKLVRLPHRDLDYVGAGSTPLCPPCLDRVIDAITGAPGSLFFRQLHGKFQ